jgi:hypothetical protein
MDLKEVSPFKDFFEPIGELVIAASMLETHITSTIRNLLRISGEDIVILTEKIRSIENRIDIFEVLCRRRIKDDGNNLESWLNDITEDLRNAVKHRNHIVHGPWNEFDPLTEKATKLKFAKKKKGFAVAKYEYTAAQIRNIASQKRWSRYPGQNGGLAKMDSGFDHAANFSSFACVA